MKTKTISALTVITILFSCMSLVWLVNADDTRPGIKQTIRVTTSAELDSAMLAAQPGDEIVLADGEYIGVGNPSNNNNRRNIAILGTNPASSANYWFRTGADGTKENPIYLRAENPDSPNRATLRGSAHNGVAPEGNIDENIIVLYVRNSYWVIEDINVTRAQKGIMVDGGNHNIIRGCNVYYTGEEAIHLRHGSSYNLVYNCKVWDTGKKAGREGYGEAVYVGSSVNTTNYSYACNFNTISNCTMGPGVTSEAVDIKEFTKGTIVENCTFYGGDIKGLQGATNMVASRGEGDIIRNNVGYQEDNTVIRAAIEVHKQDNTNVQSAFVYNNTFHLGNLSGQSSGWGNDTFVLYVHNNPATGYAYAYNNTRVPDIAEKTYFTFASGATIDQSKHTLELMEAATEEMKADFEGRGIDVGLYYPGGYNSGGTPPGDCDCGEHGCPECDPCECANKSCHDCGICEVCDPPLPAEGTLLIEDVIEVDGEFLIKVYNPTDITLHTRGLFITDDDDDLIKWQMPVFIIGPDEYILIRSAGDETTPILGGAQVNFEVALAENLSLTDANGHILNIWKLLQ